MSGSRHEPADGWTLAKFGAICKINPKHAKDIVSPSTPVSFVPMPAIDAERGEIVDRLTRPFAEVRKGYTHFAEDDVLFAKITPCMENGKVAIARNLLNGIGCGTTELHVLRPLGGILPEWIYYYVRREQFRKRAEANMTGTAGQLRVPVDFISQSELPLPPILEQRRIVAKIEDLLGRLNKAKQELAKIPPFIKKFRQSVLAKAFSGELTNEWRDQQENLEPASVLLDRIRTKHKKQLDKKYREPKPIDTSDLPELPEGWEWVTTTMFCNRIADGTHGTPKYKQEGVPLVTSKNLKPDGIDFSASKFISEEDYVQISKRSGVEDMDVLYAMIGTIANATIVSGGHPFAIKNVGLFKMSGDYQLASYLKRWLDSPFMEKYITDNAKGTTQHFVPLEMLRSFPIPISPGMEIIQINKKIYNFFAQANAIEKSVKIAQSHCEKLAQSIFAKAFRGELVEQDPDDEPASMLLEKIKSEKGRMSIQNRVEPDA